MHDQALGVGTGAPTSSIAAVPARKFAQAIRTRIDMVRATASSEPSIPSELI